MIESHNFSKASELFDAIAPWNERISLRGFVFRGHSSEQYQLTPTALRLDNNDHLWRVCGGGKPIDQQWNWDSWQIHAEYRVLRDFYRVADRKGLEVPVSEKIRSNLAQDFDTNGFMSINNCTEWLPHDMLDAAALAQHYGIPTRLLDWTYDPFIALYFAFRGALEKKGNIVLWCLNKEHISFLKPTVNRINIDFITPHYAGNPNLNAQKGLFTHWPIFNTPKNHLFTWKNIVNREPLDVLVEKSFNAGSDNITLFKKLIIPCSEAREGCKILDKLGYDKGRVFPGYEGVAKQILEKHLYSE